MLWILPLEKNARFELWLLRGKTTPALTLPERLEDPELIARGWRQVVATEKKPR